MDKLGQCALCMDKLGQCAICMDKLGQCAICMDKLGKCAICLLNSKSTILYSTKFSLCNCCLRKLCYCLTANLFESYCWSAVLYTMNHKLFSS